MASSSSWVLWLSEVDKSDVGIVGSQAAELGEIAQAGLPLAKGFVVTSHAYYQFLRENNLILKIQQLLSTVHYDHPDSLAQVSSHIKRLIMRGELPEALIKEVTKTYRRLGGVFQDAEVELRVSPTTELVSQFPFAELGELPEKVKGDANLLLKIRTGWALLFSPRSLLLRHEKRLDHFQFGMAIVVQKLLKPRAYGIVSSQGVQNKKGKLTTKEENLLQELSKKVDKHYYFPQEVAWVIEKNKLYIAKIRPFTTIAHLKIEKRPSENLALLLKGTPVTSGMRSGSVRIIHTSQDLDSLTHGDVVVFSRLQLDYLPLIKKAGAIVVDEGEKISHAGMALRGLGIPCVIGTKRAVKILQTGQLVTVNGTTGEILKGAVHLRQEQVHPSSLQTATKLYTSFADTKSLEKFGTADADGILLLPTKAWTSEQMIKVCEEASSKPVIYQLSSLKPDSVAAEIAAITHLRQTYRNLWVLLPMIRTVKELIEIKHVLSTHGLHRSPTLHLYMVIGTPAHVLLLDKLIAVGLDGISIELTGLTKLLLGVESVSADSLQENNALLWAVEHALRTAHKHKLTSLINFSSIPLSSVLWENVISWGVSTLVVPISMIESARKRVSEIERKLIS
jgi:phosphoenolpyruvate synthase/pyruvate phosphate dikinase